MRLQAPSAVAVTNTRIFVVASGANVNWRHTRLLFVTDPPGTSVHALPVQYCTSKLRNPYRLNVIVGVGLLGDWKLSCTENTSTSLMVLLPLKSTSSQSGKLFCVPSFQYASPFRSPSMAFAALVVPLYTDDAMTDPPFAGNATFI